MNGLGPRPSFVGCWDYQSLWDWPEPDDLPEIEMEIPEEGIEDPELLRQMPYRSYLLSKYWQAVRQAVLSRAGYRCAWCSAKDHLDVHHLTYARRGYERLADLMVLCRTCHAAEHGINTNA